MLFQLSLFLPPPYSPTPCSPLPPAFHPLGSCPWVGHISSLASIFLILFLTSPAYFVAIIYASYSLYLPHPPSLFPTDNSPCDLHFCESVSVLVFCLIHFCFCFCFVFWGSFVDSCEFVVILLFIFLIFFFLDKPL